MTAAPTLPPRLDATGQASLAGIMEIVKQASTPKPDVFDAMARDAMNKAMAGVTPALKQAFGAQANAEINRLQIVAKGVIDAFGEAERTLDQRILDLTAEALTKLAPRQVQVVDRGTGLVLGTVDGRTRPEFDRIVRCVKLGLNTLLVGPAGCGKTTLAEQIATGLGLRFGMISLAAGISESALVGRFVPMGDNGRFVYVPASFVDFYENGGLFLLDEMDAADPNVMLVINAALANGKMATPNPDKPIIKRHPNFRVIAAANTWGSGADRQYCGRNQLDAATLDRFCASKFALDYDEEFERKAGDPELVRWVHALRRKCREGQVRRVVGTRLILDGTARIDGGATLAEVQESFLLDWTDKERRYADGV